MFYSTGRIRCCRKCVPEDDYQEAYFKGFLYKKLLDNAEDS